jgi:hypothetical protein
MGGGLIGLLTAVEVAGFGAYILAAQVAAIIPLVGSKTLITTLFVLSDLFFVFLVLFAAGGLAAKDLNKTVRQAFAVTVSALLAIRGVESQGRNEANAATLFFHTDRWISKSQYRDGLLTPPESNIYRELANNLTTGVSLPSLPNNSPEITKVLNSPLHAGDKSGLIEGFLFPNNTQKNRC